MRCTYERWSCVAGMGYWLVVAERGRGERVDVWDEGVMGGFFFVDVDVDFFLYSHHVRTNGPQVLCVHIYIPGRLSVSPFVRRVLFLILPVFSERGLDSHGNSLHQFTMSNT